MVHTLAVDVEGLLPQAEPFLLLDAPNTGITDVGDAVQYQSVELSASARVGGGKGPKQVDAPFSLIVSQLNSREEFC